MFKPIVHESFDNSDQTVCDAPKVNELASIVNNQIRTAFHFNVRTTDAETKELQKMFKRQLVYPNPNPQAVYRNSSHPILTVLNDYANHDAAAQVRQLKNDGFRTMSIGDSINPKVKAHHNCLLLNTEREAMRYVQTGATSLDTMQQEYVNLAQDKNYVSNVCHHGSQNCLFKANVAFAVHSMYDMTGEDIYETFLKHDLDKLIMYVYIPIFLYDKELSPLDCKYNHYKLWEKDDQIMFHMGDFSLNYIHSLSNWKKLANFTRIIGEEFNIIRETSRVVGPLHIVTLSRVAKYGGEIMFTVPITEMFDSYYRVPCMSHAIQGRFILKQSQVYHYLVPKNVVDCIISYCARASDEGYKFPELATLASGLVRSIKIGAVTYQNRWEVPITQYNKILMSLFIIGAIKRADRTKGISEIFNFMKKWKGSCNIFYSIRQCLTKIAVWLGEPWHIEGETDIKKYRKEHQLDEKDAENIWDYDILELHDIIISNDYDVRPKLLAKAKKLIATGKPNSNNQTGPPIVDGGPVTDEQIRIKLETLKQEMAQASLDASVINKVIINNLEEEGDFSSQVPSEDIEYPVIDLDEDEKQNKTVNVNTDPNDVEIKLLGKAAIPRSFVVGHCAMRAIWNTLPLHQKPKQSDFIKEAYKMLTRYAAGQHPLCVSKHVITFDDVQNYILFGEYETNDCSLIIIMLLAEAHGRNIKIYDLNSNSAEPIIEFNKKGKPLNIFFKDNHYSNLRGGAQDKFALLYENIVLLHGSDNDVCEPENILEVSCAPGHLVNYMCNNSEAHVTGLVYKPGLKLDIKNPKATYKYYATFDTISKTTESSNFDLIICDAARPVDSESLITSIIDNITLPNCDTKEFTLVVKTFGNIQKVYELCRHFKAVKVHKTGVGTERYFIMHNYNTQPIKGIIDVLKEFSLPETVHPIPFELAKMESYAKKHFTGLYKKFAEYFKYNDGIKRRGKNYTFTVNAITGYPSASKTTTCIEKYKDALYIAPTKVLSIKHNKGGVSSFTPHTVFEELSKNPDKYKEIVVDEISQFPVEFLMMLNAMQPKAQIIVLGDIYQIPHVNYQDSTRYQTVKHYGVTNNLYNVYKVPQDICSYINKKFKYNMVSESPVEKGLCTYTGPLKDLKDFQFIVFNDASAKNLADQGYKASTITTYAGSRTDVVVFYIDGQSVLSQMNNRGEWIYTALTRATEKLIVVGEVDYLNKYLSLDHTQMQSYSDVNEIRYHHDKDLKVIENDKAFIKVVVDCDKISVSPPVSVDVASIVCEKVIQTVNEATEAHAFLQPEVLPPVESGSLRVNLDTLQHTHRTFKGNKLMPNVQYLKNQVSNDPKETTRCMIKRYTKKLPAMKESRVHITANLLIDALAKSVYGNDGKRVTKLQENMKASSNDLMSHGIDYITSLQKKLNHQPNMVAELMEEFNEFTETLTFVMKKQTKFDPKVGFDSSDKVGQGVAAMSKKVNVLMGAYARHILDKFRELYAKERRNIILATHGSDAELNDVYVAGMQGCEEAIKNFLLNDFSEWDSSLRKCMTRVTEWLLISSGCPEWLATWFTANRAEWDMVYFNKLGKTIVHGEEKQFTGNPFTICENTLDDVALMFLLYEFDKFQMALFKGDDSAVRCANARFTPTANRIIKELGITLKPFLTEIGEFAGFFLTPVGLFPDVLRYSCKFISKPYQDEEHFEEVLTSVQERCAVVKNEYQKKYGCIMSHLHYPEMSPEDVGTLFDFLKNSRSIKYSSLTPVSMPILSAIEN